MKYVVDKHFSFVFKSHLIVLIQIIHLLLFIHKLMGFAFLVKFYFIH